MSAVLDALTLRARATPGDIVLTWSGGALTAAELMTEVSCLAARLFGDLSPVGVALDNG
ncbi:MAG: AMP-dependent synthetase, partial [Brevundimonas sp.]